MNSYIYVPNTRTLAGRLVIAALILALGAGLALATSASGAALYQAGGAITGTVSVDDGNAAGITVELRQRANSGEDKLLASTATNDTGTYNFAGQPSAPSDAFYYVRLAGREGTLAVWHSFPIIYLHGSAFTVPAIEMADVKLIEPGQGVTMPLPGTLRWQARRSGETYRVFIYAEGKTDKAALDSGSLGTGTEYAISEGALPDGKYEAVVQVRDAVVGYGQSQARFRFTVGKAVAPAVAPPAVEVKPEVKPEEQGSLISPSGEGTELSPEGAPSEEAPEDQGNEEAQSGESPAQPDIQVKLSADKTNVAHGDRIVYTIEVENTGNGTAAGVVVMDQLPAGVTVDVERATSTEGSISVDGSTVTAQVGELAPDAKAVIEIPVSVSPDAGANLSNQANASYTGASDPVQSNAYISQVAAPSSGPPPSQPQTQPQAPPASQPQAPVEQPQAAPPAEQPQSAPPAASNNAPAAQPPASQPKSPATGVQAKPAEAPKQKPQAAPIPRTGGSFPVVFATLLVMFALFARYLRGRNYRRV